MKKERVRVHLENSEDGEECKLREFLLEDLFFLEEAAGWEISESEVRANTLRENVSLTCELCVFVLFLNYIHLWRLTVESPPKDSQWSWVSTVQWAISNCASWAPHCLVSLVAEHGL